MTMKLTKEYIEGKIEKIDYFALGSKTVVAMATLENGYEVVASSACVHPNDFVLEVGSKIAKERVVSKVWELEGYLLQEKLRISDVCTTVFTTIELTPAEIEELQRAEVILKL